MNFQNRFMKRQVFSIISFLSIIILSAFCNVQDVSEDAAAIMKQMDLDGDGVISKFEAKDTIQVDFNKIDADENGLISLSELQLYLDNKSKETEPNTDSLTF